VAGVVVPRPEIVDVATRCLDGMSNKEDVVDMSDPQLVGTRVYRVRDDERGRPNRVVEVLFQSAIILGRKKTACRK
jgi:hypothetical protein